jgi:hypothetical protein
MLELAGIIGLVLISLGLLSEWSTRKRITRPSTLRLDPKRAPSRRR